MMPPQSSVRFDNSDNDAEAKRGRLDSRGVAIDGGGVRRRCSLEMLPRPNRRQLRVLGKIGFESFADATNENHKRATSLQCQVVRNRTEIDRATAERLARRLSCGTKREGVARSLSSSRYLRQQRAKITWALMKFHRGNRKVPVSFFTLLWKSGVKRPEALAQADPTKIMQALRSDLIRCGAGRANDCLIAFIHGEFEPHRRLFVIHVHGLAFGDMIKVVDKLRKRPKYRRVVGNDTDSVPIRRPVRRTRKPIRRRLRTYSYLLKSYWPSRWIGPRNAEGKFPRRGRTQRIPEPFHSQYLLWLDQYSLQDITLMIGMKAGRQGFQRMKHKHS